MDVERRPEFDVDDDHHDQQWCSFDVEDDDDDDNFFSTTTGSGYLEDVLFEFTSKRRRLNHSSFRMQNCWTSNLIQNFNTTQCHTNNNISESKKAIISGTYNNNEINSSPSSFSSISISSPHHKPNLYCTLFPSGVRNDKKKKRMVTKVVYPFALVKPGGFEGDATLNDINERILMPPTRPVRHPVGDFACRPLVSPDGPGLSGKAVVAFTRIQTQGRGTITIIRTRD